LRELDTQETQGLFSYSAVVADNDSLQSAEKVVSEFVAGASLEVNYCVEPRRNISLTRNRALENAKGDYIAFIDDDEIPIKEWLLLLYRICNERGVDGVIGPVKPYFDEAPPKWVIRGGFYDRPTYPTGLVIDWKKGRTGNVLLRRRVFDETEEAFNPNFVTGEDQDFFRRKIDKGFVFIWCNEAVAYEIVPPIRWNRRFMLRRALLRGKISVRHPDAKKSILKSMVALPLYLVALPFMLPFGHHFFMKYLIKLSDHAGRLLAFANLNPIRESYITE
jgi:glycosyltransferase involved in cell wall biosynthesis